MAATFEYNEDNGAATGSPSKGTTRNTAVTQVNWKNVDDVATAYTASPITYGNNSFTKYQFGKFTGTFNQISAGLWAHTAGVLGTGLTLKGVVTSTYAAPSATTNAALTTNMTSVIAIGSGAAVLFHTTGPEAASPTTTLSAAGFTQYLATQLQTTVSAAAGDTATVTLTLQYNEN
jgi:hypothetical protein